MNKNSTPVTEIRSEEEKTVLKPGHAWVEKLVCVIFAFLIWLIKVIFPANTLVLDRSSIEALKGLRKSS